MPVGVAALIPLGGGGSLPRGALEAIPGMGLRGGRPTSVDIVDKNVSPTTTTQQQQQPQRITRVCRSTPTDRSFGTAGDASVGTGIHRHVTCAGGRASAAACGRAMAPANTSRYWLAGNYAVPLPSSRRRVVRGEGGVVRGTAGLRAALAPLQGGRAGGGDGGEVGRACQRERACWYWTSWRCCEARRWPAQRRCERRRRARSTPFLFAQPSADAGGAGPGWGWGQFLFYASAFDCG